MHDQQTVLHSVNSPQLERRDTLRLLAAALAGFVSAWCAGQSSDAASTKETGLAFEGLLKGYPGFQRRSLAPLPFAELPGFLPRQQLKRNYGVYRDAYTRLAQVENSLATTPRDAAHATLYAKLRNDQLAAGNSVLLHEFYFGNLSPVATQPSRYIHANMNEHMGSFDDWREDFLACARIAGEWAILVYVPYDDRWHNLPADAQTAGGWAGANPLVVCDVADHAWSPAYSSREEYVAEFFGHLNWTTVAARYRAVDRQ